MPSFREQCVYEHASKMFEPLPLFYPSEQRHAVRSPLFGRSICETRKNLGLSLEEAARLSGMQISEWLAIEAGYAPQDVNLLRALADTMEVGFERIAMVVLLCREAEEL